MGSRTWTDPEIATLRRMWAEGNSAAIIGGVLGKSRNSVISKVHRLKLPTHTTQYMKLNLGEFNRLTNPPSKRKASRAQQGRTWYRPPTLPVAKPDKAPPIPPDCKRIGLMALTNRVCKFPIGEDTGVRQLFCGVATEAVPYCRFHAAVGFQPAERRRGASIDSTHAPLTASGSAA